MIRIMIAAMIYSDFLLWAVSFALRGFGDATICDNTKATKNPQQRLMKWGIYGIPLDMG